MPTFKLIKKAYDVDATTKIRTNLIIENLTYFSNQQGISVQALAEGVTHVLAGLGQTAPSMHPNTVAAFLAGVLKLADELASSDDAEKKRQSLKVLNAAAMKFDELTKQSLPNQSVVKIAQYGSKFPDVVRQYTRIASSSPEQIDQAAKQLIPMIDHAITQAERSYKTLASNPAASANVITKIR